MMTETFVSFRIKQPVQTQILTNRFLMKTWHDYFKRNRDNRPNIPWKKGLQVEAFLRRPLIRSLQRFQLGESGNGRHLMKGAQKTGDKNYVQAMELFIKEEQEHARWLGEILQRLDAPPLTRHWSNLAFTGLRRLLGLREELFVLLVAEMIAKRYYHTLREGTNDPVLKMVFGQMWQDEMGHVAFHTDFLQRVFSSWSLPIRVIVRALWRALYRVVCLVVMLDHRALIRAAGDSLPAFWWDCELTFDEVAASIFSFSQRPFPIGNMPSAKPN